MPIPNKNRGKTSQKKPTLTDQSGAKDSDLNVIVKKFISTATLPGTTKTAMYGDFTELAGDLRELIERTRAVEKLRGKLPEALQNLSMQDLVEMDPKALSDILKPKPTEQPPAEEPKK